MSVLEANRDASVIPPDHRVPAADAALIELGRSLKSSGYAFTTITPASHARILARETVGCGANLADVFGWNKAFDPAMCPPEILSLLERAGELRTEGRHVRSGVRFSALGDQLFLHSGFPTAEADAVFFGPDTYRFARALEQSLTPDRLNELTILDIGSGSGAGGLMLAAYGANRHRRVILADISPKALRFSRINTTLNAVPRVDVVESDILAAIDGPLDLIVSNPPYLLDPARRLYRNGGGTLGFELSLRIVEQSLARLSSIGELILYTGAPVQGGVDLFRAAVLPLLEKGNFAFTYEEIDPDVFGEELENPPYDQVDRIAVVLLTAKAAGR